MKELLFNIQPDFCREPLRPGVLYGGDQISINVKEIIFFNPFEIYNRIHRLIDPYRRRQSLSMNVAFPNFNDECACGCHKKIPVGKKRWYNDTHRQSKYSIMAVIQGDPVIIRTCLSLYYGDKCLECERSPQEIFNQDIKHSKKSISDLYVDHIFPVKHGGGGCWLSNYQLLCHNCHVLKTNNDFNHKSKEDNQLKFDI